MPHAAIGRAVAALALLAATVAAAQAMYKWVDEKGVTHFSESPPPEGTASRITPKVTPPSAPVAAPAEDWKAKETEFRKRQIERGQKEQAEEKSTAKRQAQCDRARGRLTLLRNPGRIYRDNPDGTRTFMEESERDQELAHARDVEREACN